MLYNRSIGEVPSEHKSGLLFGSKIPTKEGIKSVQNIQVGDILDNGDIVKGICSHFLKDALSSKSIRIVCCTPSLTISAKKSVCCWCDGVLQLIEFVLKNVRFRVRLRIVVILF